MGASTVFSNSIFWRNRLTAPSSHMLSYVATIFEMKCASRYLPAITPIIFSLLRSWGE